jgi:hypothetical protein
MTSTTQAQDLVGDKVMKALHKGRGRRIVTLVAAFIAFAVVVGVVINGFKGRQIKRDADAVTEPLKDPTKAPLHPIR